MNKKTASLTVFLFMVFAAAAIAFAGMYGGHGHGMFSTNIGDMDTNQDNQVTFEEYRDYHARDLQAAFDMLDANNDGFIDGAEWDQFLKVHGMSKTM